MVLHSLGMLSSLPSLESSIAAWTRAEMSAERHVSLDQQGLEIADNQEKSKEGREALKEVIREFRSVPAEERHGLCFLRHW